MEAVEHARKAAEAQLETINALPFRRIAAAGVPRGTVKHGKNETTEQVRQKIRFKPTGKSGLLLECQGYTGTGVAVRLTRG